MKHWSLRLAFLLIVGVAVNAVVAWGALMNGDLTLSTFKPVAWPVGTPESWPAPQMATRLSAPGVRLVHQHAELVNDPPGTWSPPRRPTRKERTAEYNLGTQRYFVLESVEFWSSTLECGWPFLALRSRQWSDGRLPTGQRTRTSASRWSWWRSGVPLGLPSSPVYAQPERRFPVQPLLLGFALNTGFFAVLGFMLWLAPGTLRRAFRHRCGLCPACGYPVGVATTCAECGGPVSRRGGPATQTEPASRFPRLRRGALVGCAVLLVAVCMVYAATLRWGACYKGAGGWFGGVWSGRLGIGRSYVPWVDPGWEIQRYASPFSVGFQWNDGPTRWVVGIPLWVLLLPILAVVARLWWRAAVRRRLRQLRP